MFVGEETVVFHKSDLHFLQKFGVTEATEMVLAYRAQTGLPFLYDTYQLADFLFVRRKALFHTLRHGEKYYRPVTIKKRNGGKRHLSVPDEWLKGVQERILHGLLDGRPVSRYATAYHRGATLQKNAAPHAGKKYLLKLDLQNFFGSIRFDQVYGAAFNTRYYPKQVGTILTTLCCREDVLPQGAPTSPALSNLVMCRFDDAFGGWCKKRGWVYTRYCDDLTVSGDTPLYLAYCRAKAMLQEMGFVLNEEKTRFLSHGRRQSVTGLTVNETVRVSGDYKRRLRQEVYYAEKFGAEDVIRRQGLSAYRHPDGTPDGERYWRSLMGRIGYVLQIEPENAWFRAAGERIGQRISQNG